MDQKFITVSREPPQLIILIPFESVSEITSFGIIGPVRNIRSWCLQGINFHIRCLVCWHVLAEGVSTIISFWKEHSMGLLEKRLCTQHPRVSPWFLHVSPYRPNETMFFFWFINSRELDWSQASLPGTSQVDPTPREATPHWRVVRDPKPLAFALCW